MKFAVTEVDDALCISLTDDTRADADGIQTAHHEPLLQAVREARSRKIMIDLSQLKYATSSLVAFLVQLYKASPPRSHEIHLVAPTSACRRILQLTKLDKIFFIDEAVAAQV